MDVDLRVDEGDAAQILIRKLPDVNLQPQNQILICELLEMENEITAK